MNSQMTSVSPFHTELSGFAYYFPTNRLVQVATVAVQYIAAEGGRSHRALIQWCQTKKEEVMSALWLKKAPIWRLYNFPFLIMFNFHWLV